MALDAIEKSVLECLADNYGIRGTLRRLSGENLNYKLRAENGRQYVVKIVDDDMPPEVVEMEFEAIEYAISVGFPIKLPKIETNKFRKIETRIKLPKNNHNRLRIMNFIDGYVLNSITDISINMLKNVGISLAKYNLAMQGFDHPVGRRSHRWNLVEAGQHRDKIDMVEDREKQALLAWGFDAWQQADSVLKFLPQQFIHGDMNPENILVEDDRVTGLVDFGDSCINPAICDLSICLTYMIWDRENPLETAHLVTRAYQAIRPLTKAEVMVIYPLICGRLATSIAVSASRRIIDATNPNWFGGEESAWRLLRVLKDVNFSRKFFREL